jgi:telomere length regulation protein
MTSTEDASSPIREVIRRLQSPVPDISELLTLLSAPLDSLRLLPPQYRKYNTRPLPAIQGINISRHIPIIQQALLEHIYPSWESSLAELKALPLLEQYFCPDVFSFASPVSANLVLLAYSTILSFALTEISTRLLIRLTNEYPIDRLHPSIFVSSDDLAHSRQTLDWEEYIKNICSIPAKVANAFGPRGNVVPPTLEHGTYFSDLSRRCECLIALLADRNAVGRRCFCSLLSNL